MMLMMVILLLLLSSGLLQPCSCEVIYAAAPYRKLLAEYESNMIGERRCDFHPNFFVINTNTECVMAFNHIRATGVHNRWRPGISLHTFQNHAGIKTDWAAEHIPLYPASTLVEPPVSNLPSQPNKVNLNTGGTYRQGRNYPGCTTDQYDQTRFNYDVDSWHFVKQGLPINQYSQNSNLCRVVAPTCTQGGATNAAPCICASKYLCPIRGAACASDGTCSWSTCSNGMNSQPCRCGGSLTMCADVAGFREDSNNDGYLKEAAVQGGSGLHCTTATSRCDHGTNAPVGFAASGGTFQVPSPGYGIHGGPIIVDGFEVVVKGNAAAISSYTSSGNNLKVLPTLSGGGANRLFIVRNQGSLDLSYVRLSRGRAYKNGNDGGFGGLILLGYDEVNDPSCTAIEATLKASHVAFVGSAAREGGAIGSCGRGCSGNLAKRIIEIQDCIFRDNTAQDNHHVSCGGGAIGLRDYNAIVRIASTTFDHNHASGAGGAISVTIDHDHGHQDLRITKCEFVRNSGGFNAGALFNHVKASESVENHFLVSESLFRNNYQLTYSSDEAEGLMCGGALHLRGQGKSKYGTLLIELSEFSDNYARNNAGALCLNIWESQSPIQLKHVVIVRNAAKYKGGAMLVDDGWNNSPLSIDIWNMTMENNHGEDGGGGIFARTGSRITMKDSWTKIRGNAVNYPHIGYELDQLKIDGERAASKFHFGECQPGTYAPLELFGRAEDLIGCPYECTSGTYAGAREERTGLCSSCPPGHYCSSVS